jgi:hypothetical protein
VAERASLDTDAIVSRCRGRMSSDYERSRVLQTVLRSRHRRARWRSAARAAGTFSLDYERSRVLLAAIDSKALEGDDGFQSSRPWRARASDYEKARVLWPSRLGDLSADGRKAYLARRRHDPPDYENRRVLAALVKQDAR